MSEYYNYRNEYKPSREERVRDAFTVDMDGDIGKVGAWTQTAFTAGLLALQTAVLWNLPGPLDLPWVGNVAPHEFVVDDAAVSMVSGGLGAALGLMANGSISEVRGNAPGFILMAGLIPAGLNLLLPGVGGYALRRGVQEVAVRIARSMDKKAAKRRSS